jgi:hypothetical protein
VFTGSSNFSPSGEFKNGDHVDSGDDSKIAAAYGLRGAGRWRGRGRPWAACGAPDFHQSSPSPDGSCTARRVRSLYGAVPRVDSGTERSAVR